MRRIFLILALAALAPIGCDETDTKATAKSQSPPPQQQADAAMRPPRPDHPPIPDDADPVVRAAEFSSKRVADLEERIDDALTAVSDDLRALSATDIRAVDRTAEKLLTSVQLLRQSGERILDAYPKVKSDLTAIGKANANVKVGYGRAKELYLEKANLENGELQDRYLTLAEMCDAFVRTNDDRTQSYASFAKDLDKAVAKVERHVQFLKDFEVFLKLNPATSGAKNRDEFITSISSFAEQVLRFGDVLRQFRDKLRDGAVSLKLQAAHTLAMTEQAEREKALAAKSANAPTTVAQAEPTEATPPSVLTKAADATPPITQPTTAVTASSAPPAGCSLPATTAPVVTISCNPSLRCVPVLVTRYRTQPCAWGRYRVTVATHYEWRTQLVTDANSCAVGP